MAKHGKKYKIALEKIDREIDYTPAEAIKLVKETSATKFDSTVELHLRMGLDPRQADQQLRDVVVLPHGLGKTVRVAVFANGEGAANARAAGAEVVIDDDESFKSVQSGNLNFDVAISTPELMGQVGRLGRVLGPRGLMPNPKAGTVVPNEDIAKAVQEAKAGRVEYRLDKTANVHVQIGKVSFSEEQLIGNLAALMEAVIKSKPAGAKGLYIRRVTLASTMGPGVHVDPHAAQTMNSAE